MLALAVSPHMIATETLPVWFWIIYHFVSLLSMLFAVFMFVRELRISTFFFSFGTIFFVVSPFFAAFKPLMTRTGTELSYWFAHLLHAEIWAFYVLFCYLYVIIWWVISIKKLRQSSAS